MSESLHLLVVDDDADHAAMVVEFLRLTESCRGATLDTAHAYDQAKRMLLADAYTLAFVDYWLGARDGLSLLREIRQAGVETPVVVLTGRGAEEVAVDAMKAGASDYLSKTQLSVETLDRTVRYALALHEQDVQRRQAEAAVRASEERFRALVENSSDAVLLLDPEGRIQYITPSSTRDLGWTPEQMIGRSIFEFLHPDDRDLAGVRMADMLRRPNRAITAEVRFLHSDGSTRIMEGVASNRLDDPSVRAIVINARDITERRRLEEQLHQAQKMEAVGQLAGGVAHDFNNLLTAILGYSNLILDDLPPDSPMRRDLEEIRSAGERAASVTRQLLAFSRRQMLQPQIVDVNALVRQIEKLLRGLLSAQIELVPRLAPDLVPVKVDPGSLEQILVNLAVNAKDAMPHGGRLTIETANATIGPESAVALAPMPAGRYVLLAIGDTGDGMDAATRARIFEPFFTTREQGRGSGLGLATVYGMVKQSGGYIWVDSEPGEGTVFNVYLPPAESVMIARSPSRVSDLDKKQGWETVLLVEDEDAVRSLARAVLRRHGYTVLEARHGVDALRLAERHHDEIHLLLTDMVMPHMNGPELANRLSSVRAKMKVLFMSGYVDRTAVPDFASVLFLQKPFTPETLARKVRLILDRPAEVRDVADEP